MSFGSTSLFGKLAFIGLAVGIVVLIVGFSSDYWVYGSTGFGYVHQGLWGFLRDLDFIAATKAMCFIGLFSAAASFVLFALTIFVDKFHGNKMFMLLSLIAALVAGVAVLIGVTIYGAKVQNGLHWSFGMTCISGIIFLVCAAFLVAERK